MRRNERLSLPEEIMLLALHDEKGTVGLESMYGFAVGGAALSELIMRERIRLDESGKKPVVRVVSTESTGYPFLDDCLHRIRDDKKARTLDAWVSKFAQTKRLKHRLAQQLVDRGILRADEDKILLLFTRMVYPEVDPRPEKELLERIRQAIFSTGEVDPRTAVVISLANQTGLLRLAFGKKRLKERKKRLEQIANGDACTAATKQAIDAMQTAIMVAAIIPTIVVVTGSS